MIVRYLDGCGKFVIWNGFTHRQEIDDYFDTLEEAEIALEEYCDALSAEE